MDLPPKLERDLQLMIYSNRLLWEPWLETAENHDALLESLRKRGFRTLPNSFNPLLENHSWIQKPVMKSFAKKLMLKKKKS
jgi:hypothetical protein